MDAPEPPPAPRRYPPKPRPGDRVAVISPSSGLPGLFPRPYELGLRRLESEFGLVPVEYPATRKMGASLPSGPPICTRRSPIRTSRRCSPGRPGALHPRTAESLRAALFSPGPYELTAPGASNDVDRPWDDPATFASEPVLAPCDDWSWRRPGRAAVEGAAWGGNLEVLSWLLMADREIGPPEAYAGCVLFLETSEELPPAEEVFRVLRCMGERGLLRQFSALLMGRAKSWSFQRPLGREDAAAYRRAQREAVERALDAYAPEMPAVFDVDLGHTDPQLVIPYGGVVRVDGPARRITVTY